MPENRSDTPDKNTWIPDFETALEEGDIAIAGVALIQALSEDGQIRYYIKCTPGLDDMTALGMVDSAVRSMRSDIQDRWESDDDED